MTTEFVSQPAKAAVPASAILERISAAKILAVVVLDHAEDAPKLVEALQAGGISGIELTLRTTVAVGLFNRAEEPQLATLRLADLGRNRFTVKCSEP